MAGLILQVVMLSAFLALLSDFVIRYLLSQRETVSGNGSGRGKRINAGEKLFFAFLFLAVATTLARCVFRADELKEEYSGHLISNEGLFIGLEGV
jgi:hypothetical protein